MINEFNGFFVVMVFLGFSCAQFAFSSGWFLAGLWIHFRMLIGIFFIPDAEFIQYHCGTFFCICLMARYINPFFTSTRFDSINCSLIAGIAVAFIIIKMYNSKIVRA